jgi:hypothetical protein
VLYIHVTVHRNKFLFNNQTYAPNIQIYSIRKILHVSGIFSAHHQELVLYIRHGKFRAVLMNASKQSQDGTQFHSSILTLLGSGHQTCMKITSTECTVENS